MKSNRKTKTLILIILEIFFTFSPIFISSPIYTARLQYNYEEFNHNVLKTSTVSGKIHIVGNSGWVAFKAAGNCTGNGTYSDPYVIENLVIDGGYSEHCIWIENSSIYFKIENCSIFHTIRIYTGIQLENTTNGLIIDTNCTSNFVGIGLYSSDNNTLSGNILNNNGHGIVVASSNNTLSGNTANNNTINGISISTFGNNTLSGNTANNNNGSGIYLSFSNNNTILENTANYNQYGIYLDVSDYNIVWGNTLLGNEECILEEGCEGNTFKNNNCGESNGGIPGFSLFFLVGILSLTVILITKKVKKT